MFVESRILLTLPHLITISWSWPTLTINLITLTPFSELCPYHIGHPTLQWLNPHDHSISAKGVIVPVRHRWASAILYLYHTDQPRPVAFTVWKLPEWSSFMSGKSCCQIEREPCLSLYCTHTTQVGQCNIVPVPHGSAEIVLYSYHIAQQRSITHGSPYYIYHLPIWVMHLNTFDMEHTIYVWDSFFNVNSMVMFV